MTGPLAGPAPARRLGWAALAAAAAGVALAAAGSALPAPPAADPTSVARWAERVGPAPAAFAGLRLVAIAVLVWLVATTGLAVAARRARLVRTSRALDHLLVPPVRRLVGAAAGVALVAGTLVPTGAGAATPARPAVAAAVMHDIGPVPGSDAGGTAPVAPTPVASTAPVAVATATGAPAGAPTTTPTWVIAPGDTLWAVAEGHAAAGLDRRPTPAEVADALRAIVALNADRLAVPGQPDLVFPGQEFLLPGG